MSTYVVNPATVDIVVTHVLSSENASSLRYLLQQAGFDTDAPKLGQRLGTALLKLNVQAVSERYGEAEPMPCYRYNPDCAPLVQVYKSLRCLRYQCGEGTAPQTALYGFLSAMLEHLAVAIISATPEYQRATWG